MCPSANKAVEEETRCPAAGVSWSPTVAVPTIQDHQNPQVTVTRSSEPTSRRELRASGWPHGSSVHGPARETESQIIEPGARIGLASDTRPATPPRITPAAAAHDAVRPVDRRIVQIPAPFPHPTQQVEQTPSVRLLQSHRMDGPARVVRVPGDVVQRPVPGPGRSYTARHLPLCLRWEPIPVGTVVPRHRPVVELRLAVRTPPSPCGNLTSAIV